MLSFIQQRLGKTPTQPQMKTTRQESIESAFSRVAARNNSTDPSTTPSLTTATSLTDTSSELTESSAKVDDYKRSSARSRTSIGSYNENVLSAKQSRLARRSNQGAIEGNRKVLGESLLDSDGKISRERFLQESVRVLDDDWAIGALPGDHLRLSTKDEESAKRRRSTRLDVLDRASSMIEKTTTVLGKRGRETVEAGMERLQALKEPKKTSALRPRVTQTPSFEHGSRKRARLSGIELNEKFAKSADSGEGVHIVAKKPSKPWVAQGLYVGQQRMDDARLTDTKNRERKFSKNSSEIGERGIMPMPMWLGDRVIEMGRDFKLPFDIFSPLPPGQPKPDEWKKTQKSTSALNLAVNVTNVFA